MTAAEREFRPIFDSVCDDYGLSAESRRVAWESCHRVIEGGGHAYLYDYPCNLYRMLAGTKPPYSSIA